MRHVHAVAVPAGLVLCAGLMLCPGRASAHAFLKTATPAVGSVTAGAPSELVIDFTEGVEPRFSSITVQDGAGGRVDTGEAHPVGDETHLGIGLKPLPPGTYKVVWHVTAIDTHKTQGDYRFTIRP